MTADDRVFDDQSVLVWREKEREKENKEENLSKAVLLPVVSSPDGQTDADGRSRRSEMNQVWREGGRARR